MSGCNIVMLKLQRPFEQLIKLEIAVAVNAGIGRCAFLINIDEFSDNLFPEIIGKIENIKRYAELIGNTARILGILKRAAGFFGYECVAVIKKRQLTPVGSQPFFKSRYALTALSTPPLIPTITFLFKKTPPRAELKDTSSFNYTTHGGARSIISR